MRSPTLMFAAVFLLHAPVAAQSDAALQQMAEGWGRGEWNLLALVALDPETGEWQRVEESPWTTWTARRAGPESVEYTVATGETRRVEFADGVYRDGPSSGAGGPLIEYDQAAIVEHAIHGPENWRILILWPPDEGSSSPRSYSEVVMAGDLYIWTNWTEDEAGVRRRTMYSVCQLAGG